MEKVNCRTSRCNIACEITICYMTAIIKVSFTSKEGTLGAFIGNDCCGIAEYNAEYDTYWLYISPSTEAGGDVQLRFFSPDLKRIFSASSTFPFRNDTQLGTVAEPYTPSWVAPKSLCC